MKVKLIEAPRGVIAIMYTAARTCYSKLSPIDLDSESYAANQDKMWKLVKQVLDSGHQSIAENITFTFAIEGISRACANQLTRHRAGIVFAQQSMRYVNASDCDFVVPEGLSKEAYNIIGETLAKCKGAYQQLIDLGVKKEDARSILPLCTTTNLTMTVNLRELIHLCNLRLCTRAQKEIRDLFKEIAKEVKKVEPRLAEYLVPTCEALGFCKEDKCCGRKPTLNKLLSEQYNMGVSADSV